MAQKLLDNVTFPGTMAEAEAGGLEAVGSVGKGERGGTCQAAPEAEAAPVTQLDESQNELPPFRV